MQSRENSEDQDQFKRAGDTVEGMAQISFASQVNDLGNIREGEKVKTYFKYRNTGDAPLVIADIKAGCGCTVPSYSDKPLLPGDSSLINVIFDSTGKNGNNNIRITVNTNARNSVVNLGIKALVEEL